MVVRNVKDGGSVERFLSFIDIITHTDKGLATVSVHFLRASNIDISNCRGQTYDNTRTSNMSGTYKRVKAHILSINYLAAYIPCFADSVNLVGVSADDCCPAAVHFYDVVQKVYIYFSASAHRWTILAIASDKQVPVSKQLSDTCW